jgi:hypothetical protein
MKEARNDEDYDPRRNEHVTGKDGRFTKKKNATTKPKNPLTVLYLCFAFAIPYATFKRWKKDAFVSKVYVPETKGKSVLTDKKLASQVFNPRRLYVAHTWHGGVAQQARTLLKNMTLRQKRYKMLMSYTHMYIFIGFIYSHTL